MEKKDFWTKQIKAQRASGLSQTRYCAREGLSVAAFCYWVRQVREPAKSAGQFVLVSEKTPIEILVGGAVIRFSAGADLTELKRIVEALRC